MNRSFIDSISLTTLNHRLWHTACLGKENEIMVFGGSKDDLLSLDTVRKSKYFLWEAMFFKLMAIEQEC